jgi:phosphatidylserine/phosphatidylglycerophosphate/cardiolipin synthase-like enzyme
VNAQDDAISTLLRLSASTLTDLGCALSDGTLRYGFSSQALLAFVGNHAASVDDALRALRSGGLNESGLGLFCRTLGRALSERDATERTIQLILSGPEVAGTPVVDTKTTVLSLFEEATKEVLISSYVFHEAAQFFERLAEKYDLNPTFRVTFLVDLSHLRELPTMPVSVLARSFASNFREHHWPGRRMPEIWHDPRSFTAGSGGGILHAKTIIVDRQAAFITSANFTGAAQSRNIEVGVLLRQPQIAARLHAYFSGLIATGVLMKCEA